MWKLGIKYSKLVKTHFAQSQTNLERCQNLTTATFLKSACSFCVTVQAALHCPSFIPVCHGTARHHTTLYFTQCTVHCNMYFSHCTVHCNIYFQKCTVYCNMSFTQCTVDTVPSFSQNSSVVTRLCSSSIHCLAVRHATRTPQLKLHWIDGEWFGQF